MRICRLYAFIACFIPLTASADPSEKCELRLASAREELLESAFQPTNELSSALTLRREGHELLLSVETAAAADSLHESYALSIASTDKHATTAWRRRRRSICCDDWAETEDHVVEQITRRQAHGLVATITTVTGRYSERNRWIAAFTAIAKRAADDCLRMP